MARRTTSFFWHDYETWGTDPRRDRAAQFAGLRTDLDLNPLGEPLVIHAAPADDLLPQPEACLVTGITPQRARREGICEADFFAAIHQEMMRPGTCSLGYNSIRFDDEFTRYGLYRNFFDPYEREWRHGNSRWDIIDMVRLAHALRPEGIQWPQVDGVTSFRLEKLTAANGIEHGDAHDALADVKATIALARLVKTHQPKLFEYVFEHRHKDALAPFFDLTRRQPVVHVSDKYPARLGCIAVVAPLAWHPTNRNGVLVYDLRSDPAQLLDLDLETLRERLYTPADQRPEGEERPPLKTVRINHAPVVVPLNTLTPEAREKWQLDAERERRHLDFIRRHARQIEGKITALFSEERFGPAEDPDQALYDGFLSDQDRRLCEQVRRTAARDPAALAGWQPPFEDPRLGELYFRYRARNWPQTLSAEERARWDAYRRRRLTEPEGGSSITLDDYRARLARLAVDPGLDPDRRAVVSELLDWPTEIGL